MVGLLAAINLDESGAREPRISPIQADENHCRAPDRQLVDAVGEIAQSCRHGALLGPRAVLDDHDAGVRAGPGGEEMAAQQRRVVNAHVNGKGGIGGGKHLEAEAEG